MRYTVTKSFVQIIGRIWMPNVVCAYEYKLDSYAIENCRNSRGKITRRSVAEWLACNAGDFQQILDFSADIETAEGNVTIPWESEESEYTYLDCMYPSMEGD